MATQVKMLDLQEQYFAIRGEVRRVLDEVCDAQDFILGPRVERFEQNLAKYCATKYAVGASSGTDALLCTLMALDVGPGDEVIVPAFTFFATAGSVARLGAKPVFADIDPATFNIDPRDVARKVTDKTRVIMPVHLFGQLADMEAIQEIVRRRDRIVIIEDAAQAIGAKRNGKPACAHSFAGCLSFYPTKNLGGFGDGGAICTDDEAFAEKCRKLRVHGSGHTYHHEFVGGMFRLAALQAAVLDIKLKYLDQWHERRRRNAALYDKLLAGSKVLTPKIDPKNWSIYNQYVVRVPDRDRVRQKLTDAGIGSAVYYPLPLHLQECFAYLGHKEGHFPQSERASREVLALPIYPELKEPELRQVAAALREAVGG